MPHLRKQRAKSPDPDNSNLKPRPVAVRSWKALPFRRLVKEAIFIPCHGITVSIGIAIAVAIAVEDSAGLEASVLISAGP